MPPSYLDHYDEGWANRARRNKLIMSVVVTVVVIYAMYQGLYLLDRMEVRAASYIYGFFRNRAQRAQVTQFVQLLQKHDYTSAYRLWGCTETKPCPEYTFDKFMEDWGPHSKYAQIPSFDITKWPRCGSGVIVTVDLGQNREERLWVEGSEMTIGYSPWRVCPAR
jgi:hypothetical protein